jgi:creatinine amidohydrolase
MPNAKLWQDMTSHDIDAARTAGAVVAIPVGAIEQHGVHLPVDTDAFLATEVTRRAAERAGVPVIVVPTFDFGFSPHHREHAGTISLRLSTYLAVLCDIARSVLDSGFSRLVFVNGHGGNSAPLRSLVTEMVTDGSAVASVDYFGLRQEEWTALLKGGLARPGHACEQETALSLALRDEAVKHRIAESIEGLPPRLDQPWVTPGDRDDFFSRAGAAWPPVFYAGDCGYFGDPGKADAEVGAKILDILVEGLADFLRAYAGYRPSNGPLGGSGRTGA